MGKDIKAEYLSGRRRDCHLLKPRPPAARWATARLFLRGMDLILKTAPNPEPVFYRLTHHSRFLCGVHLRYQRVGATLWPFLEGGHGKPVMLLHGFGADKDSFGPLLPFLRPTCRLVIPDLPGFGDHLPDWSADYGIESQVRRLERFVRSAQLGSFHLLGISLGGYIAAFYAARNPCQVKSLCLMDSAGFSSPELSDAVKLYQSSGRNIFLCSDDRQVQELVNYLLHRTVALPGSVKRYWARRAGELLPWRRKLVDDLFAGGLYRMDDLAHSVRMPTLVLWGRQDRICHVSTAGRIMGMVDDGQCYVIDACGHIPIVEYPALSGRIYSRFLRRIEKGPAAGKAAFWHNWR